MKWDIFTDLGIKYKSKLINQRKNYTYFTQNQDLLCQSTVSSVQQFNCCRCLLFTVQKEKLILVSYFACTLYEFFQNKGSADSRLIGNKEITILAHNNIALF